MANENELVIKISGDIGDYKAALELASEQTGDLSEGLKKVAEAAAVAFAALTVEIYESVKQFHGQVTAVNELTLALENQGMYTDELRDKYREIAKAISEKTGIDDDAIVSAQASAQALLGQKEITEQLTKAVVNFASAQKIGLDEAFKLVAKSVNGQVNLLGRYGIEIGGAVTSTDKLAKITEVLTQKYDGQAEQAANASGSTAKLRVAFDDMQKAIGQRLAPAFDAIVGGLTNFFKFIERHEEVANFAADVIAASTAVAALTLVAAGAAKAFLLYRTAMIAAGLATEATALAVKGLLLATGIGALIVIATEVYQHWSTVWPLTEKVFYTFADHVKESAKSLALILGGLMTMNPAMVKAGLEEITKLYKEASEKVDSIKPTNNLDDKVSRAINDKRLAAKREAANREAAIQAEYNEIALAKQQAQTELLKLEDQRASKDTIELKKQELQLLTEAEDRKNAALLDAIHKRLAAVRRLEEEQGIVEKQRTDTLNNELLASNKMYQEMSLEQRKIFLQKNEQALKADIITERNAKEAAAKQEFELDKKNHNTFLIEQQKYGTAYAALNKAMHSAIYEGTKNAFGELSALQESSNSTLKGIGKVAAVASIIIKTAESAMNIYAGFSTIPIIGPELGIAGAAAAIAFGAEQVSKVQGAARGGLLEGGIPGVDSIPVLAMAGEIVAPRQNFEEVIGSVAASRAAKESGLAPGGGDGGGAQLALLASINDKLAAVSGGKPEVHIHGDALGDSVWLDHLMRKIGEAFEFRHARVPGINVGLA